MTTLEASPPSSVIVNSPFASVVALPSRAVVVPFAPTRTAVTVAPSTPSCEDLGETRLATLDPDELLLVACPEIVVELSPPPPESQPTRGTPTMRRRERLRESSPLTDAVLELW